MMSNTIAERFMILAHHPDKARYVIQEQARNAGLAGALLLDLAKEGKVKIREGRVVVSSTSTTLPLAHQLVLQKISRASRPRKVKSWISTIAQWPGKYRREVLRLLERKGIFRVEHKHFLVIPYIRTTLIKPAVRRQIISDLRDIVFHGKEADSDYAVLLGLVQACKLQKVITNNRAEIKECKARLKNILQSDAITEQVDQVIREMHAAVIASVVASSAAITAASH